MRLEDDSARTLANVIVGAAALGAAVVVLRTPALRRLAFGLARTAITVTLPVWLSREVREAWDDAGRRGATSAPRVQDPTA